MDSKAPIKTAITSSSNKIGRKRPSMTSQIRSLRSRLKNSRASNNVAFELIRRLREQRIEVGKIMNGLADGIEFADEFVNKVLPDGTSYRIVHSLALEVISEDVIVNLRNEATRN